MQVLRARMAVLHRETQERHLVVAALHEQHAARLEAWLGGERPETLEPVFMSTVAAAIGLGSAAAQVRGRRPAAVVAAASDATARAAHDLEVTLGEGPAMVAVEARATVQVTGMSLAERWPLYGPAVAELGVRAVIAVPLRSNAVCFGALCAYGRKPAIEDGTAVAARRIADALTRTVLLPGETLPGGALFGEPDYQAVVHQAAGMLSVRHGCGVDDAEAMLRARAFAEARPVEMVAMSVLRGEAYPN